MGFLGGSVTFERFHITQDPTDLFGTDHIDTLQKFRAGKSTKANLHEEPVTGFSGGSHLLDTSFDVGKNIVGEALHFGIRTDSCQIPGPIKKAWTAIELAGVMQDNTTRPTKSQRDEANEAVEARCAAEAEKGNYLRMNETKVLWDAATETLYLGSGSEKANDTCLELLNRAFGLEVRKTTPSTLAIDFADGADRNEELYQLEAAAFHPEGSNHVVWWNGMNDNYDYLGNEFLLWLWWNWEVNSNVVQLSDGSEVTGMFARSLTLDCPIGEHGKESISADSPVALPEARLAVGMGKLPRKAGLTLIREDQQFDFTLQAEAFTIGSARISQIGNEDATRDVIDRVESIRQLSETLDLLFESFCEKRVAKKWSAEEKKMTSWLRLGGKETRRAA